MAGFQLKNVDDSTWAKFKARAQKDGHSMRWLLVTFITHYIKHGLPTVQPLTDEQVNDINASLKRRKAERS